MGAMQITRSWREQKIMLMRRFSCLNEQDFDFEEGGRDDMLEKLGKKLQKTRTELTALFEELQRF